MYERFRKMFQVSRVNQEYMGSYPVLIQVKTSTFQTRRPSYVPNETSVKTFLTLSLPRPRFLNGKESVVPQRIIPYLNYTNVSVDFIGFFILTFQIRSYKVEFGTVVNKLRMNCNGSDLLRRSLKSLKLIHLSQLMKLTDVTENSH